MKIPIPEDLERRLQSHLPQLCQRALEALAQPVLETIAIEAYTSHLMSAAEVQTLLNLPSHLATDAFLKQHGAIRSLTLEDIQQDIQTLDLVLHDHS
ncbi:UPF0175 family protein [Leptolyngbya sp. PCC 6406]|uniref:UPF0175 family protein n=1 Tax=Leptolyngbya sp. PCC 6406 TaxID=1173264 RepID=UPI0002AC9FF1|nr:UPF0175 family protein [Leptolyngbya sp. PCC 6406]